jgi:hypothetical protein
MSALFVQAKAAVGSSLSTAPAPLPNCARHLNGKSHPHFLYVGDDVVLLDDLDWNL